MSADGQGRRERRRSFAVRLVVWGNVVFGASVVVAAVAGNATGAFAFLIFCMLALVVAVVVAVTARAFIPSLVVALPLTLLSGSALIEELRHPESFADFFPSLMRLAGALCVVIGACFGIAQRRRRTLRPATARQRLLVRIGAVALAGAGVASFVATRASQTTIRDPSGAIVVDTSGDEFTPQRLSVETGRVRFLIHNEDSYAHTFSIDELDVDEYIGPRSDRFVSFVVAEPGDYDLYCAINGHEGMVGSLLVREE